MCESAGWTSNWLQRDLAFVYVALSAPGEKGTTTKEQSRSGLTESEAAAAATGGATALGASKGETATPLLKEVAEPL